jgi:hypothetical protein
MSEPWHGRPERAPTNSAGREFHQPAPPARSTGHRSAPRHGATAAHHRTGEWRAVADRRPPPQPPRGRERRLDANRWHWLLLIPIVIPLIPGLYNRMEPTLFGLPFFFWSQLGFAFLASAVITFVHLKAR